MTNKAFFKQIGGQHYRSMNRAKKELHIVDPRDFNKAYII